MRDDASYGPDDSQQNPNEEVARRRVRPPALLLLLVGVLNMVAGIQFMMGAIAAKRGVDELEAEMQKRWDDLNPASREFLGELGIESSHDCVLFGANFDLIWGSMSAIIGVVAVFGSIRMISLHSYGLAMFGAILTTIPCVTPCCLVGQVAGVWAILILLNPDVRKAFR